VRTPHIAVVGAGIAGLVAALELSCRGLQVTVLERSAQAGGKLRQVAVDGAVMDAGPTVFTLRGVFEEIFDAAGTSMDSLLRLRPLDILARHAWSTNERLDLFADPDRSAQAIASFAGAAEARGFERFCSDARQVYELLDRRFLRQHRPSLPGLFRHDGPGGISQLWRLRPFTSLWNALGDYFRDPRLRQLFGRYATYCGSSPFMAPATLMLVAHVEQQGVWQLDGGMHSLITALLKLLQARGVVVRLETPVTHIGLRHGRIAQLETANDALSIDAAVLTSDVAALADGLYGQPARTAATAIRPRERSLSALTWNIHSSCGGFPLQRHNVFFSSDYAAEFSAIFRRRELPAAPTVYLCAQDRGNGTEPQHADGERLFCLVNAPATGDTRQFSAEEVSRCLDTTLATLQRCGLQLNPGPEQLLPTTPTDFNRMFPGSGGALYGQATHGWRASFRRPGARTVIPGLYLAGGSTHPGPGLPMAALSGRHAAACIQQDLDSMR
jgi:1-hydroxycarotenoid 3,4-desaturase